jgi:hypothetical protein
MENNNRVSVRTALLIAPVAFVAGAAGGALFFALRAL